MAFASLDLPAAVVADRTAHLGALDRLGVDAGSTGRFLPARLLANLGPQGVEELLPGAVVLPTDEVIPDGALGAKVVRQIVPLTAGAILIQQRVDHLTQIDLTRPASPLGRRKQVPEEAPLLVR